MTKGKRLLQRVRPYAGMAHGLSHPYRIAVVYLLAHKPLWAEQMARMLKMKENLLMHHLAALTRGGWITKRRDGRHQLYSLRPKAFREFFGLLHETPFWKQEAKNV